MSTIVIDGITKRFDSGRAAVNAVDLTIESGEFMVLVGPSGCGKSTLLRMIAGIEQPTDGSIRIGDRDVTTLAPGHRDVAMVFQNYALYPHMSVRRNLGYGLKVRGASKPQIAEAVAEVARMLDLKEVLDRRPHQLSGGQRQRVAMGRAIVRRPSVFLMDEPLSNLDARLRISVRAELDRLHKSLGITTVYVTHDQVEAMTLGHRAAVLRKGSIQQVDTPQNLYAHPANLFVAAFMGSPSMNLVPATLADGVIRVGQFTLAVPPDELPAARGDSAFILGIRPEGFVNPRHAPSGSPTIEIEPDGYERLGHETLVFFRVATPPLTLKDIEDSFDDPEGIEHAAQQDGEAVVCCRVANADVGDQQRIRLAVEANALQYFDRASGLPIPHVREANANPRVGVRTS